LKDIEILEDHTFKDFVKAKNYKPKSVLNHKNGLLFYCNFVRKTPTEVIREAIDEQKNNVWVTDRKIRRYFTGFVDYLVEIGNAPQTIRNKVNWVKTFYKEYGIETPKVKIPRSQHNLSLKPIPDKEVINEVLKRTTIRNRAIILLMSSSGMGAAEIRSLQYKHFTTAIEEVLTDLTDEEKMDIRKIKNILKNENVIGTWHIIRQKTSIPYITFSTLESINAIVDHLINESQLNKPIKSMEDYLFAINRKKMKQNTLTEVFQHLNDRCGLGKRGNQRLFTSHNMRKFMANTLIDKGMDFYRVEWLLGHALPPTQAAYYKMNLEVMKKEYMKYEEHLTTGKKEKTTPAEFYKLKIRLTQLEAMIKEQNELLGNLVYK